MQNARNERRLSDATKEKAAKQLFSKDSEIEIFLSRPHFSVSAFLPFFLKQQNDKQQED